MRNYCLTSFEKTANIYNKPSDTANCDRVRHSFQEEYGDRFDRRADAPKAMVVGDPSTQVLPGVANS
ncbi:MAG TPA: hypothetical protein DEV72_07090 [Ktedonobacter sp.]|nr:hypothetical protein [Ktedonobacter sp.]HCJ35049.1 hypothetical protein [Ktedonobacter sp.]